VAQKSDLFGQGPQPQPNGIQKYNGTKNVVEPKIWYRIYPPMAQPTGWHKSHFITSQFLILLIISCMYSRMVILNDEHVTLQLCEAGTRRGSNIAL